MSSSISKPVNTAEAVVLSRLLAKLKSRETRNCTPDESRLLARSLLEKPQDSSSLHWYCHRASELTREAAGYCQLWLVASDNQEESVVKWTKYHQNILDTCVDCVKCMEDALLASQFTYLLDYKKEKIDRYFQVYADWNASRLHEHLAQLDDDANVDRLNPAQSYHIFYNPAITANSKIWAILRRKLPSQPIEGWPEAAPAGIIPILFLKSTSSKDWANAQLDVMKTPPELELAPEDNYYKRTYDAIVAALMTTSGSTMSLSSPYLFQHIFDASASLTFWTNLPTVLRRFPDVTTSTIVVTDENFGEVGRRTNLMGIVINHLSRHDDVFPFSLETFETILQLHGSQAWRKKSPTLPAVALDAIKDNRSFLSAHTQKKGPHMRSLEWLEPFLKSVIPLGIYHDIVHRVFQIFLEQLQHESMGATRHITLTYFFSAVTQILRLPIENGVDHRAAMIDASNIHSSFIVAISLGKDFNGPEWIQPRRYARNFFLELFSNDIQQIDMALRTLPSLEKDEKGTPPPVSSSYAGLWEAVRSALKPNDPGGYAFYLQSVAKAALIVPLHPDKLAFKEQSLMKPNVEKILHTINTAILSIQRGFDEAILRFVDATSESDLTQFCDRAGPGSPLATLLLSPVKSLSDGAQTLIGQAYNADGRPECLRMLLENHYDATIRAMITQLETFDKAAREYLDAVGIAKVLVICYTDVLDVMCAIDGGLLFDEGFKKRSQGSLKLLPRLWRSMCNAAGIIIERTPDWATRYHHGDMTPWMRDALIFASELLEKRHVFESSVPASEAADSTSREVDFVKNLSAIMRPLTSWLRLTNEELLDLSYKLLTDLFDAFKDTKKQPEESLLQSLETVIKKLVGKGKYSKSKSSGQVRTKLSLDKLGTLLKRIADLQGDEDSDVEFVTQVFSPKRPSVMPVPQPRMPLKKPVQRPLEAKTKPLRALPVISNKAKTGNLIGKLQKNAGDGISAHSLDAQMVQRAIAERKAGRGGAPTVNLTSSSGGEPLSSSSESESEEENATSGLAQLSKLHKSPVKQQRQERKRTILLTDLTMPSGRETQVAAERHRQVQKQQIRYTPDMTPLHRIILSWNYEHDGPEPPTSGGPLNLKPVPDSFSSHRQYLDVMHPLLIVECWNSLVKSKEEQLDKVPIVIASKMHADSWVEIDAVIDQSVPKGWMLLETDVVLLEHAIGKKTLGKVHGSRQTRQGIQATIRYSTEASDMELERAMTIKSSWIVSRVLNLSTVHREYAALMGMNHYEWADAVYKPQIDAPMVPTEYTIRKVMQAHKLNYPQARAVASSLETRGFSLIQGPPGTGKTSTICGLVGEFLASRRSPVTPVQAGKANQKVAVPRKALVCAPSNAAIDELAKRLKDGVWKTDGSKVVPNMVRLGADSSINVSVKEISLEQLVEERMSRRTSTNHSEAATEIATLRSELARVKQLRQEKLDELQSSKMNSARIMQLEQELKSLSSKRIQLSSRLTTAQDKGKEVARAVDSAKRKARLDVLNEADIVCCTLSGSGHDIIEQFEFDLVIIDEAAQAIELSSLIPLKFSSDRCIMVGDPQQLPPTVISQTASKLKYDQSLFVRLQLSNPTRVHLLSIQYRMHPEISRLPSALFYEGQLEDGPNMREKTFQPWHENDSLGVFKFFDVRGQEEQADMGHSQYNMAEVNTAVALFSKLCREYPDVNFDYRIGIISMYRAQLTKLKNEFSSRWGRDILSKIDFNTVDGFQGQEKDIVILSCVRAGPNVNSIGFLSDSRRMNVAITRSRSSLFILGNAPTLKRSNPLWEKIINDANSRSLLVLAEPSYFTTTSPTARSKPSAILPAATAPSRVVFQVPAKQRMNLMTPKEWKEQNAHKMAATEGRSATSNHLGKGVYVRSSHHDNGEADSSTPNDKDLVPSTKTAYMSGFGRKRELSNPEEPLRQAPSLRQPLPASASDNSNTAEPSTSSNGTSGPHASKPPPRVAPKPKASSLFIPKKPPVKRPLPPDAPYPDPKRRPI